MWADDNGYGVNDPGYAIANFSVSVTAGGAVLPPDVAGPAQVTNGVFGVSFQGSPGLAYAIECKDSMEGSWQWRTNLTAPPAGLIWFQEPASGVPQRFYRAVYPAR